MCCGKEGAPTYGPSSKRKFSELERSYFKMATPEQLKEAKDIRGHQRGKCTNRMKTLVAFIDTAPATVDAAVLKNKIALMEDAMDGQRQAHKLYSSLLQKDGTDREIEKDDIHNLEWEDSVLGNLTKAKMLLTVVESLKKLSSLEYEVSQLEADADDATNEECLALEAELTTCVKTLSLNSTDAGVLDSRRHFSELSRRVRNIRKTLSGTSSVMSTSMMSSGSCRAHKKFKLELPRFCGSPRDFKKFIQKFDSLMLEHDYLGSDSNKIAALASVLDNVTVKQLLADCDLDSYADVRKHLLERFASTNTVYHLVLDDLLKKHHFDLTKDGFTEMERYVKLHDELLDMKETHMDRFIATTCVRNMSPETRKCWLDFQGHTGQLPTVDQLKKFILPRQQELPPRKIAASAGMTTVSKWKASPGKTKKTCSMCNNGSHPAFRCLVFKNSDVQQRLALVKQHKLCDSCLSDSHASKDCNSTYKCRFCEGKHNYLLHDDKKKATSLTTAGMSPRRAGFISTALVCVMSDGKSMPARAALDNCSTHTLVSENVVQTLQLQKFADDLTIQCATNKSSVSRACKFSIAPLYSSVEPVEVTASITSKVVPTSPPDNVQEIKNLPAFSGCKLAEQSWRQDRHHHWHC